MSLWELSRGLQQLCAAQDGGEGSRDARALSHTAGDTALFVCFFSLAALPLLSFPQQLQPLIEGRLSHRLAVKYSLSRGPREDREGTCWWS